MTDLICSVCFKEPDKLTIVNGTVMCKDCLEEIKKHIQDSELTLNKAVPRVVEYGMGDIYD